MEKRECEQKRGQRIISCIEDEVFMEGGGEGKKKGSMEGRKSGETR